MKKKRSILVIAGIVLMVLSLGLLVFSQLHEAWAQKQAASIAEQISDLLPKRTPGVPGEYSDPRMPVLQLQDRDYVCLLEVPGMGVRLPVRDDWDSDSLTDTPCRYWGSSYDGTLILGGSNRQGQFDFCSRLDVGDKVVITDMQGAEFVCSVRRIDRAKTADFERLSNPAYSLTLFTQAPDSGGYILVHCSPTDLG